MNGDFANPRKRKKSAIESKSDIESKNDIESKSDKSSEQCVDILSPIRSSVLSKADEMVRVWNEAKPFKHGVIERLCIEGFLEKVLDEVKTNTTVKFKESDLFRVYQSIDLGNLDSESPLTAKMPSLVLLKRALYSVEFRRFVEAISSLNPGTLTDQVDCAANCHTQGCHLLCHDDVIGNRKVSFILYMTDPTYQWKDEDGGRLELYDSVTECRSFHNDVDKPNSCQVDAINPKRKIPQPFPSKTILPCFNSMAYFTVNPGLSFHSVQEVFSDRPRLSIQGWYHAKEAPENAEEATLSRLKSAGKGEDTEEPFAPLIQVFDTSVCRNNLQVMENAEATARNDTKVFLSSQDCAYLRQYINETYLKQESIDKIRQRFEEESSVQLRHFLKEDWKSLIHAAAMAQDKKDGLGRGQPALNYGAGISDDWKAVGPAHKQRFLEFKGEENSTGSTGAQMEHLKIKLFASSAWGRLLHLLTSLDEPMGYRGRTRRFRPGLDYTVAHYGILTTTSVIDATLCFVAGEGKQVEFGEDTNACVGSDDDAIWDSGDCGGFECYIAADDDGDEEAHAEYDAGDESELLSVSASNNTLSLVYRDPGTMRFVKYVGSGAPSSRWDLSLEYDIPAESQDDDVAVDE